MNSRIPNPVVPIGLAALLLGLGLTGCRTRPETAPGATSRADPVEPYVRVSTADSNIIRLQIAVRQFVPLRGRGPCVWLAGVSHIGDSNYYAVLQRQLDAQSLVLFEGISADAGGQRAPEGGGPAGSTANPSRSDVSSLQSSLADSMGLVFQLSAIDYQRPNFRNSDLSIPELRQLLATYPAAPGESSASDRFEGVLGMMQGGSFLDSLLQVGLRFLGGSPKLQALGRLALMDLIGDIQGDLGRLQALPPDMKQLLEVLLQRRNEKVLGDLRTDLKRVGPRGSIAVFYGTGHMPDLERRLRQDFRYRPADQRWLTAFSVNLARAGVSQSERELLHRLIRQQLGSLKPSPTR